MTDQPMTDDQIAHLRAGGMFFAPLPLTVKGLLARLDAEIARANAAESERDAALARSLPAPVKMETVEQVRALPVGFYLLSAGTLLGDSGSVFHHRRGYAGREWYGAGADVPWEPRLLVGAWIAGPLPDLPIPTSEEG